MASSVVICQAETLFEFPKHWPDSNTIYLPNQPKVAQFV
jgi:hypothetical protein